MWTPSSWAWGVSAMALALANPACSSAADPEEGEADPSTTITDDAHLDVLSIGYDGGFELGIKHSNHSGLLAPETTLIEVRASARTVLGEAPPLPFLGPPGTYVWNLDGGWTVHGVALGDLDRDELSIHLEEVEGPGSVAVWRFGAASPEVAFASHEPLPQELIVARTAHAHRTWSFTEPGSYTLRFRISGVRSEDATSVDSEPRTYRFQVQD